MSDLLVVSLRRVSSIGHIYGENGCFGGLFLFSQHLYSECKSIQSFKELVVENEAHRFGFLDDFNRIPIKAQLWFHMHSAQLAEVHADCLGL